MGRGEWRVEGGGEAPAPHPQERLRSGLGLTFQNPELFAQALTHPSAAQEAGLDRGASYERLEFLGDSVLNLAVVDLLYERFPGAPEGELAKLRGHWVSGASLARAAAAAGVGEALRLGSGEEASGGRQKPRVLAAALEALVAAEYLGSGWGAARELVRRLLEEPVARAGLGALKADHKTVLQEWRQARSLPLPEYHSEACEGGFLCTVRLDGEVRGEGRGRSRKAAEQAAAAEALRGLGVG